MDRTVGKYGLNAGDERTHGAELQHLRAPGVGRREAPDGAAAAGAERQRKSHSDVVHCLMESSQYHSGFGDGEAIVRD